MCDMLNFANNATSFIPPNLSDGPPMPRCCEICGPNFADWNFADSNFADWILRIGILRTRNLRPEFLRTRNLRTGILRLEFCGLEFCGPNFADWNFAARILKSFPLFVVWLHCFRVKTCLHLGLKNGPLSQYKQADLLESLVLMNTEKWKFLKLCIIF